MLYPIELLRHRSAAGATRQEGVHLNQPTGVCHAKDRAFCLPPHRYAHEKPCILQQSTRPSLQDARIFRLFNS